ncbi:26390_t:CDS:2, partial [Racocetra persica]
MKVLKQSGKVTKHHDPLSPDKLKTIFNHKTLSINTAKGLQYQVFMWCCLLFALRGGEYSQMKVTQFTFLSNREIQFTKFSQKNDPGGIEENLDSLIIPVPADPKGYLGPWYLDVKLGQNSCNNFMKNICFNVGINIKDYDIINHSERTTPITYLFREGIPIVTLMSITGHKSESSYRIYSRPSEQQKKDVLSTLISVVDLSESQDNDGVKDFFNKKQDL